MRGFALVLAFTVTACSAEVGQPQTGPVDSGSSSSPEASARVFAGCTSFEDRTAEGASRVIAFSGSAYAPKCIRIKKGQSVSIAASSFHPLEPAPGNPSGDLAGSDATATRTLTVPGTYGYFCPNHGTGTGNGSGMAGAIEVVE
jgi:plastocyanin